MDTVNTTALREGKTMSQRRPDRPHNQLFPRSLASGGTELDEICPEIENATAGSGLDEAVKLIDGRGK
jgi:hypothetical protein